MQFIYVLKLIMFFICTRKAQLQILKESTEYDVLVIGGGATGCGVALDAVTRGMYSTL